MIERFGRIDVLVNNAGIGAAGAAEEISVAQAQRIFDINVFGVIRITKAVLPHMRAQGPDASSTSLGARARPRAYIPYAATKHAVEGYSESVDHEVRQHGVRVLLVEPAYTKTASSTNAMGADAPLAVYADQRQVFDRTLAAAMEPATIRRPWRSRSSPQPRTPSRAALHRRLDRPDASAPCAATFPPEHSTGRSASSTTCPT